MRRRSKRGMAVPAMCSTGILPVCVAGILPASSPNSADADKMSARHEGETPSSRRITGRMPVSHMGGTPMPRRITDKMPVSHTGRMPVPRRGAILIVAMWVIIVLTGLTLVLGQSMRVESISSANELAALQAEGVEQGAIQYVLYHLDSLNGKIPTDSEMPCEAIPVGTGAFWIIRDNDTTDDRSYCFGVTDECAKVNLNTANGGTGLDMIQRLPNMTSELAACLRDWITSGDTPSADGAKDEYYSTLSEPYRCKKAPLETVEELFLVKGASPELLYGEDTNRNGVLDSNEDDSDAAGPYDNRDGKLDRGLLAYSTIYSVSPNTDSSGGNRTNVNDRQVVWVRQGQSFKQSVRPGQALSNLLKSKLGDTRSKEIIDALTNLLTKSPTLQFRNVYDFYNRSTMSLDDFKLVADSLTENPASPQTGRINIVTAPAEVLMTLPGLEESDAAGIIAKRISLGAPSSISSSTGISRRSGGTGSSGLSGGTATTSTSSTDDLYNPWWLAEVLTPAKAVAVAGRITTRTSRYSADIVSVSGDGRSFRRCRIVIDPKKPPLNKPGVLYRQDLTHLGWPLSPDILTALRSGKSVDQLPLTTNAVTGRGS